MRTWFALVAFHATFSLYHIRFDLSRGFAKVFFNFFRDSQPLACPFGFSAEVFDIISRSLVFVKRFFKSFFNLFRDILSCCSIGQSLSIAALADSSHIIALPSSFVKGVFKTFFGLAGLAVSSNSTHSHLVKLSNSRPLFVVQARDSEANSSFFKKIPPTP